jgi:hypothetical protein
MSCKTSGRKSGEIGSGRPLRLEATGQRSHQPWGSQNDFSKTKSTKRFIAAQSRTTSAPTTAAFDEMRPLFAKAGGISPMLHGSGDVLSRRHARVYRAHARRPRRLAVSTRWRSTTPKSALCITTTSRRTRRARPAAWAASTAATATARLAEKALEAVIPPADSFPTLSASCQSVWQQRLNLDGLGVRLNARAHGRRRADQSAGRRYRDGRHDTQRQKTKYDRHPRPRRRVWRHGL